MPASGQILIDTTRTHRQRLEAARSPTVRSKSAGWPTPTPSGAIGSVIAAAVIGAACVGTSFVTSQLTKQREESAVTAFRAALAANPLKPGGDWVQDETRAFCATSAPDCS